MPRYTSSIQRKPQCRWAGWAKGSVALYCIAQALKELLLFPIEALADAAMLQPSAHAEKNADAIRVAVGDR